MSQARSSTKNHSARPSSVSKTNSTVTDAAGVKRFTAKITGATPQARVTGWSSARLFTPNSLIGVVSKDDATLLLTQNPTDTTTVPLFADGAMSQALLTANGRTLGGSVTAAITTKTTRKAERKSTHIQYDKDRIDIDDKDFTIDAENYRGHVNYQGGHVIDHKFSAGASHVTEANYAPMHYYYNAPLKEYLVKNSEGYIEILLHTSNPPRIGVKGGKRENKFHDIPIGIILVRLTDNNKAIQDAYYFPNNDYDYHALKEKLHLKKNAASTIVGYFKLKPAFLHLLTPAVLQDIKENSQKIQKQKAHESRMRGVVDAVFSTGLNEETDDSEVIAKVAETFFMDEPAEISDFLENEDMSAIEQDALQPAFDALAKFVVMYGFGNALKSEFISTSSRLILLDVITNFISNYWNDEEGISSEIIEKHLAKFFKKSFQELFDVVGTMNKEELFYFANMTSSLMDWRNHDVSVYVSDDFYAFDDIIKYFKKLICILQYLLPMVDKSDQKAFNFFELCNAAQEALSYMEELGFQEPFQEEQGFLSSPEIQEIVEVYAARQKNNSVCETYQTGVVTTTSVKTSVGCLLARAQYFGTRASFFFTGSETESETSSSDNEATHSCSKKA